jgi:hypothetical protein
VFKWMVRIGISATTELETRFTQYNNEVVHPCGGGLEYRMETYCASCEVRTEIIYID